MAGVQVFRVDPATGQRTLGVVPEEGLASAAPGEFEIATPEAVAEYRSARTVTPGEVVQTGAEGLARGATVGLSDVALGAVAPEYAKEAGERKAKSPVLAGVSELAGTVAPLLVPGAGSTVLAGKGAGAVGKTIAAAGAPVRGLAKLGTASGKAALGAAERLGIKSPALRGAIELGVGGAVEGAAYGSGFALSEASLGQDYDSLGEKLVAGATGGALAGFVFGAPIGAGSALFAQGLGRAARYLDDRARSVTTLDPSGKVARKLEGQESASAGAFAGGGAGASSSSRLRVELGQSSEGAASKVDTTSPYAPPAVVAAGDVPKPLADRNLGRLSRLNESVPELFEKYAGAAKGEGLKRLGDLKAAELLPIARRIKSEVGPRVSGALKEIDDVLPQGKLPEEVSIQFLNILENKLDDIGRRVGSENQAFSKKIGQELNRANFDTFTGLKELEQRYGAHVSDLNKGTLSATQKANARRYADLYEPIKEFIDYSVERLGSREALNGYRQAKREYEAAIFLEDIAKANFNRKDSKLRQLLNKQTSELLGGIGGVFGGLAIDYTTDSTIAALGFAGAGSRFLRPLLRPVAEKGYKAVETLAQRSAAADIKLSESAKTFFRQPGAQAAKAIVNIDRELGVKNGETRQVAYQRFARQIHQLSKAEPHSLALAAAHDIPETARAASLVEKRAIDFLASKIRDPAKDDNPILRRVYAEPPPTDDEIVRNTRYIAAVRDPLSLADQINSGRVPHRETVEAVKHVYPKLFGELQTNLANELVEADSDIDYGRRVILGLYFDLEVEPSLRPDRMRMTQEAYAQQAQQQQKPQRPSLGQTMAANDKLISGFRSQIEKLEQGELENI